jgi:hypothetical protein
VNGGDSFNLSSIARAKLKQPAASSQDSRSNHRRNEIPGFADHCEPAIFHCYAAMFVWSYRQIFFFFVLFVFFMALLVRDDWARMLGPWPDRALIGLCALALLYVWRK